MKLILFATSDIYRRLEQFNDILLQENGLTHNEYSPLFNVTALNAITSNEFNSREVVKVYSF